MAEVTQQQVVEYIKGISVLELSQLVKTLESELGVSAAAAMPMAMPGGGGGAAAAAPVEEKTDLNTDWRPASSRSLGRRFICRKRSYDFFWISIRFGIGTVVLIFEKSMRSR